MSMLWRWGFYCERDWGIQTGLGDGVHYYLQVVSLSRGSRVEGCFRGFILGFLGRVISPEFTTSLRWAYLYGLPFTFIKYYNISYMPINSNPNPNPNPRFHPLSLLLLLTTYLQTAHSQDRFNTSICTTFHLNSLYYTLNADYSNSNKIRGSYIYNYCQEVEYYCQPTRTVVWGSLINKLDTGCYGYQQYAIQLIDTANASRGVKVQYRLKDMADNASAPGSVWQVYECQGIGAGCPDVQQSTIFTFFSDNVLGFTIALQIIGIIFMTLGLYIYRASIVLLGACTMFFALLAIEIPILFTPGIPRELISDTLILSGICSFFAGYVFGYFPKLGIFMLGCWIGLIISLTLNNIAFYFIKSNPANLTLWIVMPILAVLFGVLSLFIRKTFIIFSTSLIGAYMCLRALSWYLGAFPNQFLLARKFHLGLSGPVSWKFYLYVISLVILTASSSALQYWLFTKKTQITKQPKDIDEEFGQIEANMKAKRQNLTQITNIKEIFRAPKSRAPKVLKRKEQSEQEPDEESQAKQISDGHLEDVQEVSEEKPVISKKDLHKRLIIK